MKFFAFIVFCVVIAVATDAAFVRRIGRKLKVRKFGDRDPNIACRLQSDEGVCYERLERWYYDMNDMSCKPFEYKGCGGNYNNFFNRNACEFYCQNIKAEKQQAASGPPAVAAGPDACKK